MRPHYGKALSEMTCKGREVTCGQRGCRQKLRQDEVMRHRKQSCNGRIEVVIKKLRDKRKRIQRSLAQKNTVKKLEAKENTKTFKPSLRLRAKLLESKKKRETKNLNCDKCGKAGLTIQELNEHDQVICQKRKVTCPNYREGCNEEVKADEVVIHLKEFCKISLAKARLRSNRLNRNSEMKCPQCKLKMPKRALSQHQVKTCSSRLIRCKCKEMIRHNDRKIHLERDIKYDERDVPQCIVRLRQLRLIKSRKRRLEEKNKYWEVELKKLKL